MIVIVIEDRDDQTGANVNILVSQMEEDVSRHSRSTYTHSEAV